MQKHTPSLNLLIASSRLKTPLKVTLQIPKSLQKQMQKQRVKTMGTTRSCWAWDLHLAMQIISSIIAIVGIVLAWVLPPGEPPADQTRSPSSSAPSSRCFYNKYYVDEIYDLCIVKPLWIAGHAFQLFDEWVINNIVFYQSALCRKLRAGRSSRCRAASSRVTDWAWCLAWRSRRYWYSCGRFRNG